MSTRSIANRPTSDLPLLLKEATSEVRRLAAIGSSPALTDAWNLRARILNEMTLRRMSVKH